ncbi:hypothetical protein FDJ70_07220 [Clostridium botulinum]|nr:hypothetical protein [Clostridium botulinum]
MAINKEDNNETKICLCCKKEKKYTTNNFYQNVNPYINDSFRFCKKCTKKVVDYNNMESILFLLHILDKPFIQDKWEECLKSKKDTWGEYIRQISSLPQYKDLIWKDGDITKCNGISTENDTIDLKITHQNTKITQKQLNQLEEKYGYGFTIEEYINFEKRYDRLTSKGYSEKTALHTEKLISYIIFKVKSEMELAKGNISDSEKLAKLAQKEAQDGKLNVSQLSKSDISGGIDVLSQMFEAVETEAGVIPWLPKVQIQPNDEPDLVIWSIINYMRRLEDKPFVQYKDIWNFYNQMLNEYFIQQGYDDKQIKDYMTERTANFRDLQEVYKEPVYDDVEYIGDNA